MTAQRLEGKPLVQELRTRLRIEVEEIVAVGGAKPTLAVVLVEGDPASERYARSIGKHCEQAGIGFRFHRLAASIDQAALNGTVAELSGDQRVHGVLIQMPLPIGFSAMEAVQHLDYRKDVDGVHPMNAGLLAQGYPHLVPNTPAGGMELLRYYDIDVASKHAVVIGRSNVVGRPMAFLLLAHDATVSVCHLLTPDLPSLVRVADVVVTAAGSPGLVTGDMLRPGAVIVDFGINVRPDGSIVGDVDYASAVEVASGITPVPGGTGPVTNMLLLRNVLIAYRDQVNGR